MENGKPPVHHETVFRVSVSAPGSSRAEPAAHRVLAEVVNSESDCRGFFVTLGCAMGDKSYQDAVACLPLVQAATCTGTGADGALSFPPDTVCQAP